jgi:phosphohistidine swiveling domain-containing protein
MWHRLRFGPAFRKRLKMARTYASRREQMREYSMRADNVARRYLLEAGRRLHGRGWLKEQQDVFMLSTEELVAVADRRESQAHMLSLSEIRRLMYRGYRLFNPPGELGRAIAKHRPTSRSAERAGARLLKGTGCSCGKVIGRARVVPTLAECGGFQAGDVLVTRFIDPAWTLVMGLVSAIVAEVGGLLSHGAVIAREYGLPAALDVAGATQLIKTGQLVEVDGASGTVTILEEECLAAVGM